jgi:hypothetical protein
MRKAQGNPNLLKNENTSLADYYAYYDFNEEANLGYKNNVENSIKMYDDTQMYRLESVSEYWKAR